MRGWLRTAAKATPVHRRSPNASPACVPPLVSLQVYEGWKNSKFANPWAFENFIQVRFLSALHPYCFVVSNTCPTTGSAASTDVGVGGGWMQDSKAPESCHRCSPCRAARRPGVRLLSTPVAHSACLVCCAVQARSLRRAQDVRKQLVAIMDRYKLDLVSGGRFESSTDTSTSRISVV